MAVVIGAKIPPIIGASDEVCYTIQVIVIRRSRIRVARETLVMIANRQAKWNIDAVRLKERYGITGVDPFDIRTWPIARSSTFFPSYKRLAICWWM